MKSSLIVAAFFLSACSLDDMLYYPTESTREVIRSPSGEIKGYVDKEGRCSVVRDNQYRVVKRVC